MKMLIVGVINTISAEGFSSFHGSEARILGFGIAFSRLGYEVEVASEVNGPYNGGVFQRIKWNLAMDKLDNYDVVLICGIVGWWNFLRRGCGEKLRQHKMVIMHIDGTYPGNADGLNSKEAGSQGLGFVKIVGANTPHLVIEQSKLHPHQKVMWIPWGCPEVPEGLPDPYPPKKKGTKVRVVFTGSMYSKHHLGTVNKLAEDSRIEVWIASLFQSLLTGRKIGPIMEEERKKLMNPAVNFISELIDPDAAKLGPVRYGDTWPFITHADMGLSINAIPQSNFISSKIYEYLGCGTPVVSEDSVSNSTDIILLRAGCVVAHKDFEALKNAILGFDWRKVDKGTLKKSALAVSSWERSACIFDSTIRMMP